MIYFGEICYNEFMVILRNKNRIIICFIVAVLLITTVFGMIRSSDSWAISKACQNSSACLEAVEKEKEANKNAAAAANSASAYQLKVTELSSEIASKEAEIAGTEAEVKELKKQIKITEEKLTEEQDALAELLVNMHFESDAEPIKILAGATSISDLAEKAAREETVKGQISASATTIKETKEKLEEEKSEVETLLAQQQEAKKSLTAKRSEQQALVEKYENDAESYNEVAKAAKEAQRAAEKAEQEAHPELYSGSSYTGANTYPWQADCPARQDDYGTTINGYYIGGLVCECVSYTGWKAYEMFGLVLAWGNAYNWDNRARSAGYVVDHNPAPNTIGQIDGGAYGHVFWVESVNGDGSIGVTEYNNAYATQLYTGSFHYGDFGSRTIPAGEVGRYNYIHLR